MWIGFLTRYEVRLRRIQIRAVPKWFFFSGNFFRCRGTPCRYISTVLLKLAKKFELRVKDGNLRFGFPSIFRLFLFFFTSSVFFFFFLLPFSSQFFSIFVCIFLEKSNLVFFCLNILQIFATPVFSLLFKFQKKIADNFPVFMIFFSVVFNFQDFFSPGILNIFPPVFTYRIFSTYF